MADGRRLVSKSREARATFDLYDSEGGPIHLYVDGFSGGNSDVSVTRLDFHVIVGTRAEDGINVEERMLKLRLVMPTEKWLETISSFAKGIGSNKDQLLLAMGEAQKRMQDALTLFASMQEVSREK